MSPPPKKKTKTQQQQKNQPKNKPTKSILNNFMLFAAGKSFADFITLNFSTANKIFH